MAFDQIECFASKRSKILRFDAADLASGMESKSGCCLVDRCRKEDIAEAEVDDIGKIGRIVRGKEKPGKQYRSSRGFNIIISRKARLDT